MQTASKKVINGWAMYDWANSAYNLVITSTIFPAYYVAITADAQCRTKSLMFIFSEEDFVNTALQDYALAVVFVLVAIFSPMPHSIADYKGNKKNWMNFFLYRVGWPVSPCSGLTKKIKLNLGSFFCNCCLRFLEQPCIL